MGDNATKTSQGHVCSASHAVWLSLGFRRLMQNPKSILAGLIEPGQTVADIGCGPGFFTEAMAEAVGPSGKVLAIDLQAAMLEKMERRMRAAGLGDRVVACQCGEDDLRLVGPLDFALAFYVVHEVPDTGGFLKQVYSALNDGGKLLVVEPKLHVSSSAYLKALEAAKAIGFRTVGQPKVFFSRSVLLAKQAGPAGG